MLRTHSVLVASLLTALACGGGGEGEGDDSGLEGRCQKGPFVRGSTITIQVLDADLVASGEQYTVQTENDLGEFRLRASVGNEPLELFASGFFFDEIRGQSSSAPISLRALAPSKSAGVNVNVLTHLQSFRVARLVEMGSSPEAAITKAHQEVLTSFGIPAASMPAFSAMDLLERGDGNACLLAASAILTQAATTRGGAVEAALTELLSALADDLADDGSVKPDLAGELRTAAHTLDIRAVRGHMDAWLAKHGMGSTRPEFEKFIDIDGDGVLSTEDDDSDADGVGDAEDADPYVPESPWTAGTPMLTARRYAAACTLGEKIFVFGGLDTPTSAEVYDAASDRWTALSDIPVEMGYPTCAVIGDHIYVFGRNGTVEYNPGADSWQARATMPTPRDYIVAATVDGIAYVMGGYDLSSEGGTLYDQVEAYSAATDQWTSKTPLPAPTYSFGATSLDGKIYVLAGNINGRTNKAHVYDPAADAWSPLAPLPHAHYAATASTLDGFIYVLGGLRTHWDENELSVERYDPALDQWTSRTTMRNERANATSAVLGGAIYLLGGEDLDVRNLASVDIYRPQFDF